MKSRIKRLAPTARRFDEHGQLLGDLFLVHEVFETFRPQRQVEFAVGLISPRVMNTRFGALWQVGFNPEVDSLSAEIRQVVHISAPLRTFANHPQGLTRPGRKPRRA